MLRSIPAEVGSEPTRPAGPPSRASNLEDGEQLEDPSQVWRIDGVLDAWRALDAWLPVRPCRNLFIQANGNGWNPSEGMVKTDALQHPLPGICEDRL